MASSNGFGFLVGGGKEGILTSKAISSIFVKTYSEVSYLNDKCHTETNKAQGTSSFFYCVEITGRGAVW